MKRRMDSRGGLRSPLSMAKGLSKGWIAIVVLIALLVLAPLYLKNSPYQMAVVTGAFFYAILASSWALLAGIGGQFSFAHMAFVGLGAYTAGLLGRDLGTTPLVGIIAGTLLAGVVGLVIGLVEALGAGCYPDPSKGAAYKTAFGLIIFALMLLMRPRGLFGRET